MHYRARATYLGLCVGRRPDVPCPNHGYAAMALEPNMRGDTTHCLAAPLRPDEGVREAAGKSSEEQDDGQEEGEEDGQ